jgi:putative ABC transport system permease protein
MPGLKYAVRALMKSPVFSMTAIVTIALGIGAATAIFSVTNAVLLRPLPYKNPDRLVVIGGDLRTRNIFDERTSYENYADLRDATTAVFDDMAGVATFRGIVPRQDGTPEQVRTALVTANFFRLMGARIVAGRDFDDSDGQPAAPPDPTAASAAPPPPLPAIAIISYEYWQRRFGGNSAIFGHPIQNGAPNSPVIVGALAPGFELEFRASSNVDRNPDIWTALRVNYDNRNRNSYYLRGIARVKPGVSFNRVQDMGELAAAGVRKNFPLYGAGNFHYHIEPMQQHLVAEVRPAILALMGAVTFLLLIACANVANLLLVRMSLRERELAVRTALGGSRWRLIRQMLAEALLLAGAGTLLGIGLAYAGIRELIAISPANLPRLEGVAIDPEVLGFSILAGVVSAAIFGIAPALRASRPDVMGMLRGSGRTTGLAGGGLRNAVAVIEVALSFVLLIGSGLMVRSFIALQHVELGFDPNHVLTLQLLGGRARQQQPLQERAAWVREIQTTLGQIGGVESVTAAALIPLAGGYSAIRWGKEEALTDPSKYQATDSQSVLPGFFETMRTPLIAGRTFTESDNAPDRKFVVVDTLLAAKAFPHESAVGKRILIRIQTPEPEWVEIIGVVAHQQATSLSEPGHEQVYFSDGFRNFSSANRWLLRTQGDPAALAPAVRAAMGKLDPNLLIAEMQPMTVWVDRAQAGTRFSLLLIGVFAVIAVVLASVGLYGVLSTFVRQRTAEIGVRMALGAAPSNIFGLVVGHGLGLSAAGIAIGIVAAMGLTRVMTTMLVGVQPTDPITFLAIVALFFAIAAISCWIPARRAAGLAPTIALREQ